MLIDALAVIMGHEERELCKPGHFGMVLILDTATALLGSREQVIEPYHDFSQKFFGEEFF